MFSVERFDKANFASKLNSLVQTNFKPLIGFSGGASTLPFIKVLNKELNDNSDVNFLIIDERDVSRESSSSNTGNFERILNFSATVSNAKTEYVNGASIPKLALTILGVGLDGHIASIFPTSDCKVQRKNAFWQYCSAIGDPLVPRYSITEFALLHSQEIILSVRGVEKYHKLLSYMRDEDWGLPVVRLLKQHPNITVVRV